MKRIHLILPLLPAFCLCSYAQSTGRISGSVIDASGSAVPSVTVELYLAGSASAAATTVTTQEGIYRFASVQPVEYDLSFEAKGFQKQIVRGVKVNSGLEFSMPPVTLEVSTQSEVVEVAADLQSVQTSNAEIASVITNEQVRRLPTLNRSPLGLIATQAGVGSNGRSDTAINGLRPSYTNIIIDGINIQDNFIRSNTLDFLPNMLLMDQVAEMTIATSNSNAADGGGAAQLKFVTPSGTNTYHGALYWYNRNNVFAANEWFNNAAGTPEDPAGIERPFLNQNQLGGALGGRIIKDKLFFYGNYEAVRLRQQTPFAGTVLRPDAREGIYTYRDTSTGALRSVNLLQLAGAQKDPQTQALLAQLPSTINRTDIGDGLNTGGFGLNRQSNRTRDNVTTKIDYIPSIHHILTGTFLWNRDNIDRPDADEIFTPTPAIGNDGKTKGLSLSWRWSPTNSFTNEARGGFNFSPGLFNARTPYPAYLLDVPLITNPVNTFMPQGRYTDTWSFQDNANWYVGRHTLSLGFSYQRISADSFDNFGVLPTYLVEIGANDDRGLTPGMLPGIGAADFEQANQLLALHAGYISQGAQTFNVTSINSGFVPGAENLQKLRLSNYAGYFSDTWRINQKLTITTGVRWEFYTPVTEARGLSLLPRLINNNPIETLLNPDSVLDWAGSVLKRPWYKKDWNNFGPNVGIAWQPFGDNKTVIRAGYSVNFPNDELIVALTNNVYTNSGLSSGKTDGPYTNLTVNTRPAITAPEFEVPRSFGDNYALDPFGTAFGMPDPNLRIPYVQQWSFGIQHEIGKGILEARYVGNRSTKQFRAFDYNQILVRPDELPGYLDDFKRAQNNGNLARNATGVFDPRYNSSIAGSQPLSFFPQLVAGGFLDNPTVTGLIQRGEAGQLANTYQTFGLNGDVNFYRNPNSLGTNLMTNYSNSSYHALQIDYRRTFRSGVSVQANYAFSKVLSDAAGDGQTRFEAFLDLRNGAIERARTPYDLTHAFKLNGVYDLPFGHGRAVDIANPVLDQILGGWAVSGFMTWQSGAPYSVLSTRGTLNRGARSANNTAITLADGSALDKVNGFYMTPNGPMFINPSATYVDGRGVGPDGDAPFDGQVFYNPGPGEIGSLQRRMFSGPRFWSTDLALLKTFPIGERQSLEFKSEWFNFSNTPSFLVTNATAATENINNPNFGKILDTASSRRIIQFGLYYRF